MEVFTELKSSAEPLMEAYKTDLDADQGWIDGHPGTPFIHYTRNCGTYMIGLIGAESYPAPCVSIPYMFSVAKREKVLADTLVMANYHKQRDYGNYKAIHYFTGRSLLQIDHDRAIDIVRDYVRSIREAWARKGYRSTMTAAEYAII